MQKLLLIQKELRTTPSVVSFKGEERQVLVMLAKRQAITNPNTIMFNQTS